MAFDPGAIGCAFSEHRFDEALGHLAKNVRWTIVGYMVLEGADAVRRRAARPLPALKTPRPPTTDAWWRLAPTSSRSTRSLATAAPPGSPRSPVAISTSSPAKRSRRSRRMPSRSIPNLPARSRHLGVGGRHECMTYITVPDTSKGDLQMLITVTAPDSATGPAARTVGLSIVDQLRRAPNVAGVRSAWSAGGSERSCQQGRQDWADRRGPQRRRECCAKIPPRRSPKRWRAITGSGRLA